MGRKTNKVLTCTQEEIDAILPENKELIDDFMDYLEATDHSQKTCIVYQDNLNLFFTWLCKYCKNKDFVDIKKKDILKFQTYMVKNELSSARIRNIKSSLSSLSNYIESMLVDEDDKWENFRNIINKIPNPVMNLTREKTVINDEQLYNLLDELIKRKKIQIAMWVAASAFIGTRKAETLQLKMSWFTKEHCKNGLYMTPEIRCKGFGKAGKKLIKYGIKNKLDKYLDLWIKERERMNVDIDDMFVVKHNGQWSPATIGTISKWMDVCSDILGVTSYSHMYRHFYVSYLSREDIPINVIKEIVGHSSVEMTERYNDNSKEDEFMKYFSDDGIVHVEKKDLSDL